MKDKQPPGPIKVNANLIFVIVLFFGIAGMWNLASAPTTSEFSESVDEASADIQRILEQRLCIGHCWRTKIAATKQQVLAL